MNATRRLHSRASAEKFSGGRGRVNGNKQDRKRAPLSPLDFISIMYESPGAPCPPVPTPMATPKNTTYIQAK